ncbi:MAG: hypothetical protein AB1521_02165 [Bacteroidota bacterium]
MERRISVTIIHSKLFLQKDVYLLSYANIGVSRFYFHLDAIVVI